MKLAIEKLPDDPKLLKEVLIELYNETSVLNEQVKLLRQKLFGRKSEKYKPDTGPYQLNLPLEQEEVQEDPDTEEQQRQEEPAVNIASHKRRKRGRKHLSDKLLTEERIIDISDEKKLCECGCIKSFIGAETSKQLEHIPANSKVIVNIRPKYACKNCEGTESKSSTVTIAPPPAQIIPKSFATASLLAYIITSKYVDSLPFYRLSGMFSRQGVQLSRATMCSWIIKVAALLKPMIELFIDEINRSSYIHSDETPFQVLKEVGRKSTQKSYMWVVKTGAQPCPTVLFHYSPSRASNVAQQLFENFTGYIQTDGYSGYNGINENENQTQVGCMAHSRRKFRDAIKVAGKNAKPGIAHKAFDIITQLYKIEAEAVDRGLTPEEVKELRQAKAKPILLDFKKKLERWKNTVVPGSNTGKAVWYTLKEWPKLIVYLEDGRLKIDNNAAERSIRPFAVGKKNWLFSDTSSGADASATIFSITETAKANGHEPFWYMYALLEKLPELKTKEDFIDWMPQNIDKQTVEDLRMKYQNPKS